MTSPHHVAVTVPHIELPFPSRIHPLAEAAVDHSNEWVRLFGMIPNEQYARQFEADRFGELAARAFADAAPSELMLMADWMGWYFAFDDSLDTTAVGRNVVRTTAIIDEVVSVLSTMPPALPPDDVLPGTRALADLWARSWDVLPGSSWCSRFADYMIRFVLTYSRQAETNSLGEVMDANVFAYSHRPHSSGAVATAMLIEPAMRVSLTDRIVAIKQVGELYDVSGRLIAWLNDLHSVGNERAVGDLCNFVAILHHETGKSYQACAEIVAERIRDEVRAFEETRAALPQLVLYHGLSIAEGELVQQWSSSLAVWIRGVADWYARSARYHPDRARALSTPAREGL